MTDVDSVYREEYILEKQELPMCMKNEISLETLEELQKHANLAKKLIVIHRVCQDKMSLIKALNRIYIFEKILQEINKEITKKEKHD